MEIAAESKSHASSAQPSSSATWQLMWHLEDVALVRSAFAIAEAERNLDDSVARTRLYRLIHRIEIADGAIRLSVASAD
jgi:hypothetical protein